RAAIERWLGLLSPEARALLTTAALIGPEFELGLLEKATATAPERAAALISSGQEAGIVTSTGRSLCRFAHPLLREVLSSQATTGERVELHRGIALTLEKMGSDDLRPYFSVLAYHWRESARLPEEIDKAIGYSIRAGDAAAKASALGEAVSRWDDALHLNKEHQRDLPQRAQILVRLAEAWPGRTEQGLKNWEGALAIYEQLGMTTEAAHVHTRLCGFLQHPLHDLPRAEKHFHRAEALFRQIPPNKSLVLLYASWCFICIDRLQISEVFEAASRAVEIAEAFDAWMLAIAGNAMGNTLFAMGRLRECLEWTERTWEEADKIDAALAGGATLNSCFYLTNLRDYPEALKRSRREMARPRNQRSAFYEGHGAFYDQITQQAAMGELNGVRQ